MTDETKPDVTKDEAAKPAGEETTENEMSADELEDITGGTANAAYYSSKKIDQ